MRCLIVYATREGQTEKIAGRIAAHLRDAGADAVVHNAANPFAHEGDFDVVVYGGSMQPAVRVFECVAGARVHGRTERALLRVGICRQIQNNVKNRVEPLAPLWVTRMHVGSVESELVDFMRAHHDQLGAGRSAFFLVLLSAAGRDPERRRAELEDARQKVESVLPVRFDHIEMIAGALRYSKYRMPMRWIMKRIAAAEGGDTDTSRDYEYTDWDQVERFAKSLLE